ncbi:hypothetical protein ACFU7Y_29735 [Kitasatospora sp. NPDC057542]|uniref:recombination directionality factor n=1 Tax=Kitasatospora sp. NPDC057542 TaxID=3346162 RepID=UPI00369C5199
MTAANIREVLQGSPESAGVGSEAAFVVAADEIDISMDRMDSVSVRMVRRVAGKIVHLCDGKYTLGLANLRVRCGCPLSWKVRRLHAMERRGPRPHARVVFRLSDLPDAGVSEFSTSSWDFAEAMGELDDLGSMGGPRKGVLGIEAVRFPTRTGLEVSYCRPVLQVATLSSPVCATS